jgi:ABC-type phosphate transport system substrate-binding protein
MTRLTAIAAQWLALVLLLVCPALAGDDVRGLQTERSAEETHPQVIVHQDVPPADTALSIEKVRDIFMGRQRAWSDGTPIVVGIIPGKIHEAFCQFYLDMSSQKFDDYWRRKTGGAKNAGPRIVRSEQDMTVFIANIMGSIGYIMPD